MDGEENNERYISFPQYIMQTMYTPGDNKQHLVERVMANVWANSAGCAHVFEVEFVDSLGGWQGVWIAMTEADWSRWLLAQDMRLRETIESTIKALEDEANRGVPGDGCSD